MSIPSNLTLAQLLVEVQNTPAAKRINYRDRVAAFGPDAIIALQPWLTDTRLSGFAIRAVGRAAGKDEHLATAVLTAALTEADDPTIQCDLREELRRLGITSPSGKSIQPHRRSSSARHRQDPGEETALSRLIRGHDYRRADLHSSGLGGNVQKGISYPAGGDHVLLFSNPSRISKTGYHDRWLDHDIFIYYGEWDGPGEMQMRGGNQRIAERSPRLHLFVASESGYRYEGQFAYQDHRGERTIHSGAPATAIVFILGRVR